MLSCRDRLYIMQVLHVSAQHVLSKDFQKLVEMNPKSSRCPFILVPIYPDPSNFGVMLFLDDDLLYGDVYRNELLKLGFSQEFVDFLVFAASKDFEWLRLDYGASPLPGVPVFV